MIELAQARDAGDDGPDGSGEVTMPVVLDLLEATCRAGAPLTAALVTVGTAVGGSRGACVVAAGDLLAVGAPWDEAWASVVRTEPSTVVVHRTLRAAWYEGVAPAPALRAAADALRRERDARAVEAAARLGVRLVVPLGLCHLPAFVCLGIVPVLLSMAAVPVG